MIARAKELAKPFVYRLVSVLLRQGSQLASDRMIAEYRRGRFPMVVRFGRVAWHDPEQRAILPLDERFHVPRDVRKLRHKPFYEVTFDRGFDQVVRACVARTARRSDTWISPDLVAAYSRLCTAGYAHSVEVWHNGALAGGAFGLTIGGFFSRESVFSREIQVAKVAVVHLVDRLRSRGFVLQDVQVVTNFTRQFGVTEIPRAEYKSLLSEALTLDVRF